MLKGIVINIKCDYGATSSEKFLRLISATKQQLMATTARTTRVIVSVVVVILGAV